MCQNARFLTRAAIGPSVTPRQPRPQRDARDAAPATQRLRRSPRDDNARHGTSWHTTPPGPGPVQGWPTRRPLLAGLALGALLVNCVSCGGGSSLPPTAGPRTGATAADELRTYAQFVRDVHPAPWRFVTEAAFEARVAAEADAVGRTTAPTELEVIGAFQRTLAELGDAHVAVTSGVFQPGAAGASFLPLLVKDVEGALLIDAAADPHLVGATLVAIDDVPVDELRQRLSALVMKDGANPAANLRGLEHDFTKLFHSARCEGFRRRRSAGSM